MKKIYLLLIILNNIASLLLITNHLSTGLNIFFIIGIAILYLSLTIAIIKRTRIIAKLDIISVSLYMLFVIFMLLFSIIYQNNNFYNFSMLYFSGILFVPSLIFNIYNLFNNKKEEI